MLLQMIKKQIFILTVKKILSPYYNFGAKDLMELKSRKKI